MKVVIDTSSLIALVRYYLPFDASHNLYDLIKGKIKIGDIIILDAVLSECEYQGNGLVIEKLGFLKDKDFKKQYKVPRKTDELFPPAPEKFIRQAENQFSIGVMKNKLNQVEFDLEKERWLSSADAKLIIYCLKHIHEGTFEEIFLVTEETKAQNDLKVFKKIPSICNLLSITVLTLPELIDRYSSELKVQFERV